MLQCLKVFQRRESVRPVADPRFPRNCMKITFWTRGRTSLAPPGSAIRAYSQNPKFSFSRKIGQVLDCRRYRLGLGGGGGPPSSLANPGSDNGTFKFGVCDKFVAVQEYCSQKSTDFMTVTPGRYPWLVGLGVWFSLRVREVPGSNPGRALLLEKVEYTDLYLIWMKNYPRDSEIV